MIKHLKIFSPQRNRGFTLIEILVVMALVALLFGIFAPSFADFFRKNRLANSSNTLETTLQLAFSSARATPYYYFVQGVKDDEEFTFRKCKKSNCSEPGDPLEYTIIDLDSGILISSDDFNVQFLPPHGDMQFIGTTDEEITISLLSGGVNTAKLKLYKKSGLIEQQ